MSTLASDVHVPLKTTGTAIKIAKEILTNNQTRNIFGETFTKTTIFMHKDKYWE